MPPRPLRAALGLLLTLLLAPAPTTAQVSPAVERQARPFPLHAVRLLDGPFRDARMRNAAYLLALDPDRLLHGFRVEAGLEPRAPAYEGWESMGLDGHTLGHYLSALSMHVAATGDARFARRIGYLVDELAAVQAAHGDGYVAAIPNGRALFADVAAGRIDTSPFRLNGAWAPWYVLHKELAGLLDAYRHAGNDRALEVARGLADWAGAVTAGLSDDQWQHMLACEHGGMNEVLADLYALTGEARYLTLSRRFHHRAVLAPLVLQVDRLEGLHANTQIPKVIGLARQFELLGDDSLRTAAGFFWQAMTGHHTYAIGGNSMDEYLGPPGDLSGRLTATTAETCNTYNMLRLTRQLFLLDPQPRYADFYERALYNHILASQEPETGMFTYYMSLKPGHFKTYSTPESAFWCCVGSGMENHVKYGDSIYFHDDAGLTVNLFIPSELDWTERGLRLRQDTRFPDDGAVRLSVHLDAPRTMALRIRHPAWAAGPLAARVNGADVDAASRPGSYLTIERTWEDGDTVEFTLGMALRVEPLPGDPRRVALLYGPVVLAGALGTEGLPQGGAFADGDTDLIDIPAPPVPVLVADAARVDAWVRPLAGGPLTFHTVGAGRPRDVLLKPFFRLHHERYTVYWDLFSEEEWPEAEAAYRAEEERVRALEAATVDVMRLGEMVAEERHAFRGERTRSWIAYGRKYREAGDGGWFSFDLGIAPGAPAALVCTYRDGAEHAADVSVEGRAVSAEPAAGAEPEGFYDRRYPIPADVTRGRDRVRVRIAARPGGDPRVFGCRTVRE